ncbi:MAG: PucC family protein [Aestuariivirga sp.]|uniref:PucC family protein n=1 Tax=Aestuariivirga sp. TaxID=2650926 RepID=UPI0025C5B5B0|nr:PucC family protein [Aestuariivirga sp.]MCA3562500.1 PucC family protein [Aestuariivirga sp.]
MNRISQSMMRAWTGLGAKYLPFADAATEDVPLSRLLRLSLFQVSAGMTLVLLVGTLNRVMIVELGVPASLVAVMLAMPLVFAPFRALIGFKSDTHKSELGWKRVPYFYKGALVQFGGLAIMPFALLVLARQGHAASIPPIIGQIAAALAFLLVGAGLNTTQTVGLALATDLTPPEKQPNVVGLMYVALLAGSIVSALIFGALLYNFSPGRLVQVIQGAGVATLLLNGIAVWKQEARGPAKRRHGAAPDPTFEESWTSFMAGDRALARLIAVGVGTLAFSMQDVMLEPYGGQVLGLAVSRTTLLTAAMAAGGLIGFSLASYVLSRGFDAFRMASLGAMAGVPAFLMIILAAPLLSPLLFGLGTFLIGFGAGLFGHGTLTATMNSAPKEQRGLALGAWGAVQATAAGIGVALGGVIRDALSSLDGGAVLTPYLSVYILEVILLIAAIVTITALIKSPAGPAPSPTAPIR